MDTIPQEPRTQSPALLLKSRELGAVDALAAEEGRSDSAAIVFDLKRSLDEVLGEWRAQYPYFPVGLRCDESFPDPLYGDVKTLRTLILSLLRRIANAAGGESIKLTVKRDRLFSGETHLAFSLQLEVRGVETDAALADTAPPRGGDSDTSRHLIQKLGGELRQERPASGGIRFIVRLRFPKGNWSLLSHENGLEGIRVLIVDDDSLSRMLTASMLRDLRAQVATARHGLEALELARQQEFDLIFLDIEMPVLGGVATCQELRLLPGFEEVPVLAMTSHEQEEQHAYYLERGMQDVMVKPLNKKTIIHMAQRYLLAQPLVDRLRKPGVMDDARHADFSVAAADYVEANSYQWVDGRQLHAAFDASKEVLELCVTVFAKRYPNLLDDLSIALEQADVTAVCHLAHELKGMLANLWVPSLSALAADIEDWAREGRLEGSPERLEQLTQALPLAINELQEDLRSWPEMGS